MGSNTRPFEDRASQGGRPGVALNTPFPPGGRAGGCPRQHPGRGHHQECGCDELHALPQRTHTTCRSRGMASLYRLSRVLTVSRHPSVTPSAGDGTHHVEKVNGDLGTLCGMIHIAAKPGPYPVEGPRATPYLVPASGDTRS